MTEIEFWRTGTFIWFTILVIFPLTLIMYLYIKDRNQKEHSILRNFPILGKIRYIFEKIGPEMRQYWFNDDQNGTPFSRLDYLNVIFSAKYKHRKIGFGSKRDFTPDRIYLKNDLFPRLYEELCVEQAPKVQTRIYEIEDDGLFTRKEHTKPVHADPFYLSPENVITIGQNTARHPFTLKGLIGQSGMSYGSLGERAITALSIGLGRAGGTWMNTGEGGLSDYHLAGQTDIIMQIGPAMFGVRTPEGKLDWEELEKKAQIPQVKAIELKLAQGAKTRGGHLEGEKVTPDIARMRKIEPWKTVNSPNRFPFIKNSKDLVSFIDQIRSHTGLPVGIKIVVGHAEQIEELASQMKESNIYPDFITIDGGEGGTGATYQELADSVGLPILQALPIVDRVLKQYGLRDQIKIFASGKLITPDLIATTLALGADCVNIARGFMFSVGCIQAQVCHNNTCPVGVATTDQSLQHALDIEEKSYRVTNYVLSLREGLYNLAAAAGIDSPTKFSHQHITSIKSSHSESLTHA
ncbi:FMN-binding glutamate synthase family protein [Hazenella sp. IB182353]|uniref:FMN-binding glutamate synthase family protein n=1 Tax=Polycladospora coralii TaxID=2771432 RepID=UPI0017472BBA|nr:FMN-binding glutamate synthase family protein [Polycladospora coralii]MBS7529371.1 FMN-binding glutamate synthase family protein [Polycladospora coralii]